MDDSRVEIAIIGAGPAGISAAINAKIRSKSVRLFGKKTLSNKVQRSEQIRNYPGIAEISGEKLNDCFRKHLDSLGLSVTDEQITGIYHTGNYYTILADKKKYEADTVILATGVESVRPVDGENEFLGRGVSYCATCDGALYRDKTIAVICDSESAEHEVDDLRDISKKTYYYPLFKNSRLHHKDKLEYLPSPVVKVMGEDRVEKIILRDETEIPVDGVFFLKESVSPAVLLRGLPMENGHIVVDRDMATGIEGCFAVGDCTGRPYQIAKAAGEGNIAVHSAIQYLAKRQDR